MKSVVSAKMFKKRYKKYGFSLPTALFAKKILVEVSVFWCRQDWCIHRKWNILVSLPCIFCPQAQPTYSEDSFVTVLITTTTIHCHFCLQPLYLYGETNIASSALFFAAPTSASSCSDWRTAGVVVISPVFACTLFLSFLAFVKAFWVSPDSGGAI